MSDDVLLHKIYESKNHEKILSSIKKLVKLHDEFNNSLFISGFACDLEADLLIIGTENRYSEEKNCLFIINQSNGEVLIKIKDSNYKNYAATSIQISKVTNRCYVHRFDLGSLAVYDYLGV